jgi:hypothetical protein
VTVDFGKDKTYRSRFPKDWSGSLEGVAAHYCEIICRDYRLTDPTRDWGLEQQYPNIDRDAFDALRNIGQLARDLAGWAVDHQAGKSLLNVPLRNPLFPQGMAQDAVRELDRIKQVVRSNAPEKVGAAATRHQAKSKMSVQQKRETLCSILYALNAGLEMPLFDELIESFDSLNVGETTELFRPEKRSRSWTKAKCQLEALEYVEFWRGYDGAKSAKYYKDVKDAFDGHSDPDEPNLDERIRTARRYKEQAVRYMGLLLVESRLKMAHNTGTIARANSLGQKHTAEVKDKYSRARLDEIGKRFRGG